MSKTLTITTKAVADKLLASGALIPAIGRALKVEKLDRGKYKPDPAMPYVGREVPAPDSVHAIFPVRRKDRDGPYVQLMCISEL